MSAAPDDVPAGPGPAAERLLRRRAARSFHPEDAPAREWLALAARHEDAGVAALAASAQAGAVPVAQVVAAVDELEREAAAAAAVRAWLATHSREDLAPLMDDTDADALERTTPRRAVRTADLDLSEGSKAFLRETDIWSDEPRIVDLRDLERGPRARRTQRRR